MSVHTDPSLIHDVLTRGVEAVYPSREDFTHALQTGKRLRFYLGIDPTAPHLHIGHALQLRKLAEFQKLGHEVILLLGSFTAMIGDPTDKTAARTQLTQQEVMKNAATYKEQASKILSFSGRNAAKLKYNHKWLARMNFADVVELASHFTVQQMSERDMFDRRLKEGKPIYVHEFLYPLMQGYDSVAMDVDAEIGGSDQTFNMLAGRTLMKAKQGKNKFVIATKLLINDEGKKMSKSEGGFIALSEAPEEMYGKLMAMDDSMILPYFELATDVSSEEIEGLREKLRAGTNPRDIKAQLAATIVEMFHSKTAAEQAAHHFDAVFRGHEMPTDMPTHSLTTARNILDVLVESGLATSKSEARRLVGQHAIKVDGAVVDSDDRELIGSKEGVVLQRGKRQFVRLTT